MTDNAAIQLDGEQQNLDRFRSQMVLCAIEQGLGVVVGKYCTSLHPKDPVVRQIGTILSIDDSQPLTPTLIQAVISDAFFKQLFDLAIFASKGTPETESLRELYDLAEKLDLFEIRNAVAHPNRRFFTYFWYRVAAFAADPRWSRLDLNEIGEKFHRACAGMIERPPEQWLSHVAVVPNNLPMRFEHTITGLVGRDEERRRLWADTRNPRKHFMAIVSPGGNGKTALALEFLDELTSSTEGACLLDAVIFISLKSTYLSIVGTVEQKCSRTIHEVEEELKAEVSTVFAEDYVDFESVKEKFAGQRFLLCIDNLETLLLEAPDALVRFESQLPVPWKILVTSRIPVEHASSIALTPLKTEAAKQLVRSYLAGSGYPRQDEKWVASIVSGTRNNPLAIKLVIDTYVGGKDITESITKASEDTTAFSFSNLLDVLSPSSIDVMEGIYVEQDISRMSLAEALQLSAEDVSRAIQDLCRTSLARREFSDSSSREYIRLNEQVRELLRIRPMRLATRERVEKHLRALRLSVSVESTGAGDLDSIFSQKYIPPNIPVDLQSLINSVNKCVGKYSAKQVQKQQRVQGAYQKIMLAESEYSGYELYWTARARLMMECKDHSAAHDCLDRAVSIEPENFAPLRLKAELLLNESRLTEAIAVFETLKNLGATDPERCGSNFASITLGGYLHALIFFGNFDLVNTITSDWFKHKGTGLAEVVARIKCFKNWAENHKDPMHEMRFIHALNTYESAIVEFGSVLPLENVCKDLIEEMVFPGHMSETAVTHEYTAKCFDFIGRYLGDVAAPGEALWALAEQAAPRFQAALSPSPSPAELTSSEIVDTYRSEGYVIATITNRAMTQMRTSTSFMFAVDENHEHCFLHLSCFKQSTRVNWRDLKVGSVVALKRVLTEKGSTKWTAIEIVVIAV